MVEFLCHICCKDHSKYQYPQCQQIQYKIGCPGYAFRLLTDLTKDSQRIQYKITDAADSGIFRIKKQNTADKRSQSQKTDKALRISKSHEK